MQRKNENKTRRRKTLHDDTPDETEDITKWTSHPYYAHAVVGDNME